MSKKLRLPETPLARPLARDLALPTSMRLMTDGGFISVDPGLQGTGLAVWDRGTLCSAHVLQLPSLYRTREWPDRALAMAELVQSFVGYGPVAATAVVCEMMEYQGGGKQGLGWRTGDLQRTLIFIGAAMGLTYPVQWGLVPVHRWKGQLPKRVVEDRIKDRLGHARCAQLNITSHAWDAVGIGLWALGRF